MQSDFSWTKILVERIAPSVTCVLLMSKKECMLYVTDKSIFAWKKIILLFNLNNNSFFYFWQQAALNVYIILSIYIN